MTTPDYIAGYQTGYRVAKEEAAKEYAEKAAVYQRRIRILTEDLVDAKADNVTIEWNPDRRYPTSSASRKWRRYLRDSYE